MDLGAILDQTLEELEDELSDEYEDDESLSVRAFTTNERSIINNTNNDIDEDTKEEEKEEKLEAIEDKTEIDETITRTLQALAKASSEVEGMETTTMESKGEEIMDQMLSEFEKLGEKNDYEDVVNTMIMQLLAKDLMYEPISQVTQKYPEWLAENKDNLTEEDYQKYGKQYQCFQKILDTYETEPDNFDRLKDLMFEIQQYDAPPAELFGDLAPGLQFDQNGIPLMPNMGPDMPGLDGVEFPDQNCSIM